MPIIRHMGRGDRERDDDRRRIAPLVGVLLATLAVFLYLRAVPERIHVATGRSTVAATVFPLYDIARNVAGDAVEVALILPPGSSPHTFEPSPSTVAAVSRASVVYAIGHGLDDWVDPLLAEGGTAKLIVDAKIDLQRDETDVSGARADDGHEGDEEDQEGMHGHGRVDPHYWLDVRNAMTIAKTVSDDLSRRYPEHADTFDANLDRYLSALRALHDEIAEILVGSEERRMVTLHDGWGYFADAYALEIVGTFEPSPGREPTPRYLAELAEAVSAAGTTRLFTEPQIATGALEAFLIDNGLTLALLDPLGGGPARESYAATMRYNAMVVAGR